jgi:hypothetical protein
MKALGFRNRLAARPVSDVAPAQSVSSQCRLRNPRADLRLPPHVALAVILAAVTVALCEPSGLAGWLKALAAGVVVPGVTFGIVRVATGQWRVE